MKKRFIALILFFIFFLSVAACDRTKPVPETELDPSISANKITMGNAIPSPRAAEPSILTDENPIDRAFSRVVGERHLDLDDNVVLAYLYALQWYNEYNSLLNTLWGESEYSSWDSYVYNWQLTDMAHTYAEKWVGSNDATSVFNGIARFYKLQVYDCLTRAEERGDGIELQTDENELYQYLSDVSLAEYIADDVQSYANVGLLNDKLLPMLSSLPDDDIYLSFAPPFGAVLSVKGGKYFYRWSNGKLTPRAVLPQLSLSDYDKDGEDELAVILYVASGTECAVTELHIVELDSMWDKGITGESMETLLLHRIWASYDPVADVVTVGLDDQAVRIDASHTDKEQRKEFSDIDLIDMIYFNMDGGVLSVHIHIGLCGFDYATPFDYVDFYADVIYADNGMVSLANCRIE